MDDLLCAVRPASAVLIAVCTVAFGLGGDVPMRAQRSLHPSAPPSPTPSPTVNPSAELKLGAVMRQVHFAFQRTNGGFAGGDASYASWVGLDGSFEVAPIVCLQDHDARPCNRPRGATLKLTTSRLERGSTALLLPRPQVASTHDGGVAVLRGRVVGHFRNGETGC